MNPDYTKLALEFYKNNKELGDWGEIVTSEEIAKIPDRIRAFLPVWYTEIIQQIPFCQAMIGVPFLSDDYPPEAVNWIEMASLLEMIHDSTDMVPGDVLSERGYVHLGTTQEEVYLSTEDFAVYEFDHSFVDSIDALLSEGRKLVCQNFSDLFRKGTMVEWE